MTNCYISWWESVRLVMSANPRDFCRVGFCPREHDKTYKLYEIIIGKHFLLILLLLYLMVAAPFSMAQPAAGNDAPITLIQAQLLITTTPSLPQTAAGWQAVMLPDTWPASRYEIADNGWYRFVINQEQPPTTQQGIYLPRLNMNAAVYFNGELLGDGGSFENPLGRNWARPLYFKIPDGSWKRGNNVLDIRLRSDTGQGILAPVMLGATTALTPRYERAHFFQISLTTGLFLVLLVISLFFFSLWLRRRSDSQYGWFALVAAVWALLSLNHVISVIPVSAVAWDWLIYSSIAWWTTGIAMFAHRYIGYRNVVIEKILITYAVVGMVLYASAGKYLWLVGGVWMTGSIFSGIYTVARLLIYCRGSGSHLSPHQTSARDAGMLALGIALVLLVGIQDWMVQNSLITGIDDSYAHHHLLVYSAPVLIMFIAWHLNRRFINALSDAEKLNADLETRIAANRRELEASYSQLRVLENSRATAEERERISRDLHDGLGGIATNISLLSDMAQLENSAPDIRKKLVQISELSRESLDEIRGFMRNLDDAEGNWHSVAADMRLLGHKLLEPHAVAFHFSASLSPDLPNAVSMLRLNLFRIYREALINVIKHAQAKNVNVKIEITSQQLSLEIEDDGIGLMNLQNDGEINSRGLSNLHARALSLGGTLSLRSASTQRMEHTGTHLRLQVPLPLKSPESGIAQ